MLNAFITSKSKIKLLTLFLTHPDERFYYTELHKRLGIPHSALQKELKKLVDAGLLKTSKEATIRYYWVNKRFPLYEELKSIVLKTVGLADAVRAKLSELGAIEVAFIYGSVAKNVEDMRSDVDLMVIGDPNLDVLDKVISDAEKTLQREINYTVFTPKEFKQRAAKKQAFVMDVLTHKKIFVLGDEDELRRITAR